MQQGRAAMSIQPFARLASYNDPQKSKYPGKLKPLLRPMAADLRRLSFEGAVRHSLPPAIK
jgi:multiple sugar transport system substrate-binding protein